MENKKKEEKIISVLESFFHTQDERFPLLAKLIVEELQGVKND